MRQIDAWGRVEFDGEDAVELLMRGHDLTTLSLSPTNSIVEYNEVCQRHDKLAYVIPPITPPALTVADDTACRCETWLIPEDYRTLCVHRYLLERCERPEERQRVEQELGLFEKHGLMPVLRLMIFLIDHFRDHQFVWGVGRGSSVASYCLFLIGVHKINSLAYALPIEEFLRDK